jgi:hypothetical protein
MPSLVNTSGSSSQNAKTPKKSSGSSGQTGKVIALTVIILLALTFVGWYIIRQSGGSQPLPGDNSVGRGHSKPVAGKAGAGR